MIELKLRVFIDVFGRVSPVEKISNECPILESYYNDLLRELFVEQYCYGDLYEDLKVGTYVAEFDLYDDYTWENNECNEYLQIKEIAKISDFGRS